MVPDSHLLFPRFLSAIRPLSPRNVQQHQPSWADASGQWARNEEGLAEYGEKDARVYNLRTKFRNDGACIPVFLIGMNYNCSGMLTIITMTVHILCLVTFVGRNQLTLQCKISNNKFKIKGTAQL